MLTLRDVRFHLLACDYDGTIAKDGAVEPETISALRRVTESGRELVLVTGRELPDLLAVFPEIALFSWVIAENGGVLFHPASREEVLLASPAPAELVVRLRELGVTPISVGRTLVATWEPNETLVVTAIRELGLELQVIFNKGAVMVLPASVNKRSGLETLLKRIDLSPHNCVGVGDAENDHAFLSACEYSVAVNNALPALKSAVDWVTNADHGAGVRELIDALLGEELGDPSSPERLQVTIGRLEDGSELTLAAFGPVGLIAGSSGAGKTTATSAILEQFARREYQVCIVDPEGDYDHFPSAVVVGSAEQPPDVQQLVQTLRKPETHVVVNLLGVALGERPRFFLELLTALQRMRASTGRPHWLAIDEAHHVLDSSFDPMAQALPLELTSTLFITIHPERLQEPLLKRLDFALFVGPESETTMRELARSMVMQLPHGMPAQVSEDWDALFWRKEGHRVTRTNLVAGASTLRRHRRKYAHGELGPSASFYFRGPESKLNLRAQNLMTFTEISAGVDDDTWLFHLRNGDYSSWVRTAIKDDNLAGQIAEVEGSVDLSAQQSRAQIRELIEAEYTLPE